MHGPLNDNRDWKQGSLRDHLMAIWMGLIRAGMKKDGWNAGSIKEDTHLKPEI